MRFRLILCAALLLLSSCAHTRIAARDIPPEGEKLARLTSRNVNFHLDCNLDEIVGHQYLLIALPFGRISVQDPSLHLTNHLIVALAELGIRGTSVDAEHAAITITCHSLSLSAYDYFFFRQIVGILSWSLQINYQPLQATKTPVKITRVSALKAFAFYAQLEYQLHHLLLDASREISQSPAWNITGHR